MVLEHFGGFLPDPEDLSPQELQIKATSDTLHWQDFLIARAEGRLGDWEQGRQRRRILESALSSVNYGGIPEANTGVQHVGSYTVGIPQNQPPADIEYPPIDPRLELPFAEIIEIGGVDPAFTLPSQTKKWDRWSADIIQNQGADPAFALPSQTINIDDLFSDIPQNRGDESATLINVSNITALPTQSRGQGLLVEEQGLNTVTSATYQDENLAVNSPIRRETRSSRKNSTGNKVSEKKPSTKKSPRTKSSAKKSTVKKQIVEESSSPLSEPLSISSSEFFPRLVKLEAMPKYPSLAVAKSQSPPLSSHIQPLEDQNPTKVENAPGQDSLSQGEGFISTAPIPFQSRNVEAGENSAVRPKKRDLSIEPEVSQKRIRMDGPNVIGGTFGPMKTTQGGTQQASLPREPLAQPSQFAPLSDTYGGTQRASSPSEPLVHPSNFETAQHSTLRPQHLVQQLQILHPQQVQPNPLHFGNNPANHPIRPTVSPLTPRDWNILSLFRECNERRTGLQNEVANISSGASQMNNATDFTALMLDFHAFTETMINVFDNYTITTGGTVNIVHPHTGQCVTARGYLEKVGLRQMQLTLQTMRVMTINRNLDEWKFELSATWTKIYTLLLTKLQRFSFDQSRQSTSIRSARLQMDPQLPALHQQAIQTSTHTSHLVLILHSLLSLLEPHPTNHIESRIYAYTLRFVVIRIEHLVSEYARLQHLAAPRGSWAEAKKLADCFEGRYLGMLLARQPRGTLAAFSPQRLVDRVHGLLGGAAAVGRVVSAVEGIVAAAGYRDMAALPPVPPEYVEEPSLWFLHQVAWLLTPAEPW